MGLLSDSAANMCDPSRKREDDSEGRTAMGTEAKDKVPLPRAQSTVELPLKMQRIKEPQALREEPQASKCIIIQALEPVELALPDCRLACLQ